MKPKFAAVLVAACILAGCANPYAQFYRGPLDARAIPYYDNTGEPVKVVGATTPEQDTVALFQRGYSYVGQSSFTAASGRTSETQLMAQAQKIGAHVVVASSKHDSTVSGVMPLTMPTTSTSFTTGNATAFGAGGPVTAFGSATTTTYGTSTTYVPYTVERSAFFAAYFVKVKLRFGVLPKAMDVAAKKLIDSNSGVIVAAIARDSPAFEAAIFEGDIIVSIDGRRPDGPERFNATLNGLEGRTVDVVLYRDGKELRKQVAINRVP